MASTFELLSVVVYGVLVFAVVSRKPQKNYLSMILATPFIFLSESFVLTLMEKYFQHANVDIFCTYSGNFGMLYDGVPWMLFFFTGWFWGIPLLIFYMWHQAFSQKRSERIDSVSMQKMDEIERVRRTRESLKKERIPRSRIFLTVPLFMAWDFAIEYFAIRSELWSYPRTYAYTYASFTVGGIPYFRILMVGFAGFMLFLANSAIEMRSHRPALKQVKSPTQTPPEVEEKSWAWNILVRIISYNIAILFWFLVSLGAGSTGKYGLG